MKKHKHPETRKRKQARFAGIPFRLVHRSHLKGSSWKHESGKGVRVIDAGMELLERTRTWDKDEYIKLNREE